MAETTREAERRILARADMVERGAREAERRALSDLGARWMGQSAESLDAEARALRWAAAEVREAREAEPNAVTAAFHEGLELGAKVEQRVAREALQQAVLRVLGKDRGDGAIDLGALGREVFAE